MSEHVTECFNYNTYNITVTALGILGGRGGGIPGPPPLFINSALAHAPSVNYSAYTLKDIIIAS